MIRNTIISCISTFICFLVFSCGDGNNITPNTIPDPVIPDTLPVPKNIKVNSFKIKYFSSFDSVTSTLDTATLASFKIDWDTVHSATYYVIMLFLSEGVNATLIKNFTDTLTEKMVDSLKPNERYMVKIRSMKVIDTETNEKDTIQGMTADTFVIADLFQPLPPKNISVSYSGLTARVTWSHSPNKQITGYEIYQLGPKGKLIKTIKTDSSISSALFTIGQDSVYKFNIRTMDTVGLGILCSTVVYDVSAGQDNSFKLPYKYLSTYSTPPQLPVDTLVGEMIGVTGGIFAMGNIWSKENQRKNNEEGKPVHEVVVSSFYLGKSEITNDQYVAFLNDIGTIKYDLKIEKEDSIVIDTNNNPIDTISDTIKYHIFLKINDNTNDSLIAFTDNDSTFHIKYRYDSTLADTVFVSDSGFEDFPVSCLYWKGAAVFCNWLTDKNGSLDICYDSTNWNFIPNTNGYRLPTEAEFEYVQSQAFAYPGTKQRYPWGYKHDVQKYGSKEKGIGIIGRDFNTYSIFNDLSGNVAEWCNDWSDYNDTTSYYEQCLADTIVYNPLGPKTGEYHILRGGSYMSQNQDKENSSNWRVLSKTNNISDCGFRVARNVN